jgi:hypothetical protein
MIGALNIMVYWLIPYSLQVSDSNLGPDTDHPEIFCGFFRPYREILDYTLSYTPPPSFHISPNLSFIVILQCDAT